YLADVSEECDLTEMIKASGARVFLSLDLPEDPAEEEKAKADSLSNPELKALVKRRSEFIQKMTAQAAAFDSAGIKFGFSAMDTKYSELHKNLRRMVEAGLNPESALAALTINAAQILGVDDRLGTIEKGKIANEIGRASCRERAWIVVVEVTPKDYRNKERGQDYDEASGVARRVVVV